MTGLEEWKEFNYQRLMVTFGELLLRPLPLLAAINPRLTGIEPQVFDEDSFEHIFSRAFMPLVRAALLAAWPLCYPDDYDPIDIRRGDCAKRTPTDDFRFYPGWAGVSQGRQSP